MIPLQFDYELTIDTKDLLNAIDRASFIKNDGVSVIKFSLSEAECVLSSKSIEVGSSTEVLSSASFEGQPITSLEDDKILQLVLPVRTYA